MGNTQWPNFNIIITNNKYRINNNPLTCNLCHCVVFGFVFIHCRLFHAHSAIAFAHASFRPHSLNTFLGTLGTNTERLKTTMYKTSIQSILNEMVNNDNDGDDGQNDDVDDYDDDVIEIVLHWILFCDVNCLFRHKARSREKFWDRAMSLLPCR